MGLGNGGGFTYYDEDLNCINNDQFGTCTVESLDPLTVTYTINEGVTWSDGMQIDAADMMLTWAAQSDVFNDAEHVIAPDGTTAEADADGNPIIVDASGAVGRRRRRRRSTRRPTSSLEGYTYKASTGVSFDAASEGLTLDHRGPGDLRGRPVGHARRGTRSTSTTRPTGLDRRTSRPTSSAEHALGIEDPTGGQGGASSRRSRTTTARPIKPIAEFWNTGFDATRCRTTRACTSAPARTSSPRTTS